MSTTTTMTSDNSTAAYTTVPAHIPIVDIKGLNVKSKEQFLLKDINIEIPKNKLTVLLGPSGCGKTTLLKCLNRLTDLYPDLKLSGKINIDGENVLDSNRDITRIRQKMGLLLQRPFPLPMSIYDNIAYGLKLKGIRKKSVVSEKVEKHLKEVALWQEVKDRLHTSAQKLADEPTSALDPISSRVIEEEFMKLKDDYTIILVTHILRQAKRLADYVIFMYYGEIVEHGPAEKIFENPQTEILQEYLKVGH